VTRCCRQRGTFLVEALVGILIFTLGVLGLVGLQARSIGYMSDAQYRAEAAYLANSYIAKMWADQASVLRFRYESPGQPEYDAFQQAVHRLPGASAIANNPQVTIVQTTGPGVPMADACAAAAFPAGCNVSLRDNSALVTIAVQWLPPAVEAGTADVVSAGQRLPHNYTVSTVIGVD
jgi:type IV pilus assembly protein PilV